MTKNNLETVNKEVLKFDDVYDYLRHNVSEEDLGLIIADFESRYGSV